jgi:hypothetical protein
MKRAREELPPGAEGQNTKAKRERTAIDYESICRNSQHLQSIWAQTLGRVAKGNSTSVRVEVEKGLDTFFPKLLEIVGKRGSLIDPSEETRNSQTTRDKELAEEEERLSGEVARLEQELASLTQANLKNRNDLRAIASLGVEPVDIESLLDSVPQTDRNVLSPFQ